MEQGVGGGYILNKMYWVPGWVPVGIRECQANRELPLKQIFEHVFERFSRLGTLWEEDPL